MQQPLPQDGSIVHCWTLVGTVASLVVQSSMLTRTGDELQPSGSSLNSLRSQCTSRWETPDVQSPEQAPQAPTRIEYAAAATDHKNRSGGKNGLRTQRSAHHKQASRKLPHRQAEVQCTKLPLSARDQGQPQVGTTLGRFSSGYPCRKLLSTRPTVD